MFRNPAGDVGHPGPLQALVPILTADVSLYLEDAVERKDDLVLPGRSTA